MITTDILIKEMKEYAKEQADDFANLKDDGSINYRIEERETNLVVTCTQYWRARLEELLTYDKVLQGQEF